MYKRTLAFCLRRCHINTSIKTEVIWAADKRHKNNEIELTLKQTKTTTTNYTNSYHFCTYCFSSRYREHTEEINAVHGLFKASNTEQSASWVNRQRHTFPSAFNHLSQGRRVRSDTENSPAVTQQASNRRLLTSHAVAKRRRSLPKHVFSGLSATVGLLFWILWRNWKTKKEKIEEEKKATLQYIYIA